VERPGQLFSLFNIFSTGFVVFDPCLQLRGTRGIPDSERNQNIQVTDPLRVSRDPYLETGGGGRKLREIQRSGRDGREKSLLWRAGKKSKNIGFQKGL